MPRAPVQRPGGVAGVQAKALPVRGPHQPGGPRATASQLNQRPNALVRSQAATPATAGSGNRMLEARALQPKTAAGPARMALINGGHADNNTKPPGVHRQAQAIPTPGRTVPPALLRGGAVLQRTIYKKMGKTGPVSPYKTKTLTRTDFYKDNVENWDQSQTELVMELHKDKDVKIWQTDLLSEISKGKTISDFDEVKSRYQKQKKKKKRKPNEEIKKEYKRLCTESKRVDTKSKKTQLESGDRLIRRSSEVYKRISNRNDSSRVSLLTQFAKGELKKILNARSSGSNGEHRASTVIDGVTLTLHVKNIDSVYDIRDVYATIHVALSDTNRRSSYSAFAYPDPEQDKGVLHPLFDYINNKSLQILNILETLRNEGQFIPSMMEKGRALKKGKLNVPKAIVPKTFGVQELSGVSGQSRDEYSNRVILNTMNLHEKRNEDSDDDSLVDEIDRYLEESSDDESRRQVEDKMLLEYNKVFL